MGALSDERKKEMEQDGFSKHHIMYYDAVKQRDYEPLLLDPTTPNKIITDVVHRVSLLDLKIIALKHPNISDNLKYYIMDKADRKPYQKDIIRAVLYNGLSFTLWERIILYHNTAKRVEKIIIELIKENDDVINLNALNIILNSLSIKNTLVYEWIEAIINSKVFNISIIDNSFFKTYYDKLNIDMLLKIINSSKFEEDIKFVLYKITKNDVFLPQDAKDIFLI